MNNSEETKEKITHHVHTNGRMSKKSETFIDTDAFNKEKMEISDTKVELRYKNSDRQDSKKAV